VSLALATGSDTVFPNRTRRSTHSSVAPLPLAVVVTCSTDALRSRKPLMTVFDELVEERLLDPAHVGIVDSRRAAEQVPQPLLVARDEKRNVAGDRMRAHRGGLRTPTAEPGPPGAP
jgi:hypothetical protein